MLEFIELHSLGLIIFFRVTIILSIIYHLYNALLCFKYEDAEPGLLGYCIGETILLVIMFAVSFFLPIRYFAFVYPIGVLPTVVFKIYQRFAL